MRSYCVYLAALLIASPASAFSPRTTPLRRRAAAAVQPLKMAPLITEAPLLVSDLVSATEVYGPIFGMGLILCFSGLASAFVVGSLVDGDNVAELSDQFYEKGLRDLATNEVANNSKKTTNELTARRSSEKTMALPKDVYLD
jgi:hypothetical protein